MNKDLQTILQPVIKYCLKRGLTIRELLESSREVFVEESSRALEKEGQKENVSRIAVITGLQRPVVKACLNNQVETKAASLSQRVLNAWKENKRFKTKNNQPKVLSFDGDRSEFANLVRTVSKDIHPGTVLFDLQRQGRVEVTESGLKISSQKDKKSIEQIYNQVAEETRDFVAAMLDNLESDSETPPNYQITSTFDNIDETDLPEIRARLGQVLSRLQDEAEAVLKDFDLDVHPDNSKKGGSRVVVGLYTKTT
jgi:predicted RNA-binding protein Jag